MIMWYDMIIDIFSNYLIVHIKFSMKYYYFILKLKRSFVYAVLSLSLLLSPSLTHFFVIRLNGKLSTARQRRRMRNEAKIKLIYKWRKKLTKIRSRKQNTFSFTRVEQFPFCACHYTSSPLQPTSLDSLLPWHCLVSPLPPLWKIRFICARLLYYLNSCVIFLNFRVLLLLSIYTLLLVLLLLRRVAEF